ncbi:hypothetical protein KP509_29G059200 [Ceratopteris richardii]|uniref:Uncharacterized protein n=1 Tax=Ceratopteris richardii TaxID=49495 RepID=A0A8T2R964_CERRI|nr:hypothetical protein KP509_29G059200 [Ceratopteris richardii]
MRSSGRYEPSVGRRNPYAPTHQHSMRSSILPLALINAAILLLSIPVLVMGIWLAVRHPSGCVSFLQWPLIVLGAVMMVVSLVGLVGAAKRRALLLWVYLCFMTVLILLLLAFIIFAFVVTRRAGDGHSVWAGSFKEYELHECSPWFRHRLSYAHTWRRIRACIVNDHVCSAMNDKYPTQSTMFQSKLSYIEAAASHPPYAASLS